MPDFEQALKRAGVHGGRVTGDEVLEAAREADSPFSVADVTQVLSDRGREATVNAVRNHLNRLVTERNVLDKREGGLYELRPPPPGAPQSPSDDDIPF